MKLKIVLIMILAVCLLAACSGAPKKEDSKAPATESSKEESVKEESSTKSESAAADTEEDEDEEEEAPESSDVEEEEEEEEEEEAAEPETSTEEESGDQTNSVYKLVSEGAPEDTLLVLINEPDEAFLYATRVTDEFDLTTQNRVMMIPRYEHSTIRLWTLQTEFDDDGQTAMQVHDELLYEVADSTRETVLMTSVERIEDSARYAVEIITPEGEGEYYFNFYGENLPQTEFITAAKG